MTSWNGNIFCVTDPLCWEFTGHRWIPLTKPVTRNFDVYFDLRMNKWLSKQSWGWWFETPSRHCNGICLWHHSSTQKWQRQKSICSWLKCPVHFMVTWRNMGCIIAFKRSRVFSWMKRYENGRFPNRILYLQNVPTGHWYHSYIVCCS